MPIVVKNLTFVYSPKSPFEKVALDDISFTINDGDFVGIIGSTGSGKSTLIQHLNGLIRLKQGEIEILNIKLHDKKVKLKLLRKGIGMLFQYPEYQLFEETVVKDVMFGPKNFGFSTEEAEKNAREAIEMVGLDFEDMRERSPFELSGGQKRRVAIAGILAYKPEILVLDEPTSGLDPVGKREMLELIASLKARGAVRTVLMISHNMDEIAEFCTRVLVINNSKLLYDLPVRELFSQPERLEDINLAAPTTVKIWAELRKKGVDIGEPPLTVDELTALLCDYFGGKKNA